MLFQHMPVNTFVAFLFFVMAKLTGIASVILIFGNKAQHTIGGYTLLAAFCMIAVSITLCIVQMRADSVCDS